MFLTRGRAFVGKFFRIAQSSLLETGPRVSAVKLMHTIQFYNNGEVMDMFSLLTPFIAQVLPSECQPSTRLGGTTRSGALLPPASTLPRLRPESSMYAKLLIRWARVRTKLKVHLYSDSDHSRQVDPWQSLHQWPRFGFAWSRGGYHGSWGRIRIWGKWTVRAVIIILLKMFKGSRWTRREARNTCSDCQVRGWPSGLLVGTSRILSVVSKDP